uniref:R2R3MYB36 n=1 Tax=Ginkgo biloba TaxID=3311 RepID=A0A222UAD7_GINBI|nr:R2R3MYB36 [Ginkgo biloba]
MVRMESWRKASSYATKKSPWSHQEDLLLIQYIQANGEGDWRNLPQKAGLGGRSAKSCRLRWRNYLRPDIKHGNISPDEEELIIRMHRLLGNRWSLIAGRVPGRTDNQIKKFWNTQVRKKHARQLIKPNIEPKGHEPWNHDNSNSQGSHEQISMNNADILSKDNSAQQKLSDICGHEDQNLLPERELNQFPEVENVYSREFNHWEMIEVGYINTIDLIINDSSYTTADISVHEELNLPLW